MNYFRKIAVENLVALIQIPSSTYSMRKKNEIIFRICVNIFWTKSVRFNGNMRIGCWFQHAAATNSYHGWTGQLSETLRKLCQSSTTLLLCQVFITKTWLIMDRVN